MPLSCSKYQVPYPALFVGVRCVELALSKIGRSSINRIMHIPTYNYDLTTVAVQAAYKAGEILRKGFGTRFNVTTKSNPHDLVTEFDNAAEEAAIGHIRKMYPTHSYLAEESGSTPVPNAPVCWIIDPLDGTLNYAHHIPTFCVSIAALVGNAIQVGVIYHPLLDELFVAEKGHGAFLNETRLAVSPTENLHMAVAATGFPYDSSEIRQKSIESFSKVLDIGNPIRLIGSAALSLAYVAAGRFDAFWGINLNPWDVAAGKLLIEEAGGTVTTYTGQAIEAFKAANTLATNTKLHSTLLTYMR